MKRKDIEELAVDLLTTIRPLFDDDEHTTSAIDELVFWFKNFELIDEAFVGEILVSDIIKLPLDTIICAYRRRVAKE